MLSSHTWVLRDNAGLLRKSEIVQSNINRFFSYGVLVMKDGHAQLICKDKNCVLVVQTNGKVLILVYGIFINGSEYQMEMEF